MDNNKVFGNIMYEGKFIDLDKTDIEELEKISKEISEQAEKLKQNTITVFNQ